MSRRLIHIARWDDFQHPDVNRTERVPWIKNYTRQLDDWRYLDLSPAQRALLHDLRLEYARTRREILDSTAWLSRRLGYRVARASLEALNHAGFITFSASSLQAGRKQPASLDTDTEGDKRTPPPSPPVENSENQAPAAPRESRPELVTDEALTEPGDLAGTVGASCGPEPIRKDGSAPGSVSASVRAPVEKPNAPKRDELWDLLEAELGAPATQSEHGRRNRAVKELREIGATPELVRGRLAAYRQRWPHIALTATALVANWTVLGQPAPTGGRSTAELLEQARKGAG